MLKNKNSCQIEKMLLTGAFMKLTMPISQIYNNKMTIVFVILILII